MLDVVGDLFKGLEDLSTSPWFYLVIFLIAYLDSMVPVVPSETMVILGGVAAGQDELAIAIVIACGAAGAFLGDSSAYFVGRRFGPRLERRFFSKPKGRARIQWANRQLKTRGGSLLITARFVPGGRTVVTFCSGMTRQALRRFLPFIAIAGILWASYAGLLGYLGGKTFADNHTLAFVFAFGCALAVTGIIELVRWLRHRSRPASERADAEVAG